MIRLLIVAILLAEARACVDDKGRRHHDGEEWISLDSFLVRCEFLANGAWKTRVLHCLTHSQTSIPIGGWTIEDGHLYRCIIDGDEVRIRVRPATTGDMLARGPQPSRRPLAEPSIPRPGDLPNVFCPFPGLQTPLIFGQEMEYQNGIVECGLNGTMTYTHCLLPPGKERLKVGAEKLVGSTLYSCKSGPRGIQLATIQQQPQRRSVGVRRGALEMQMQRGLELTETSGCLLTGRPTLAMVGEELLVDGKYLFKCGADGVSRIESCVLPGTQVADNRRLMLGDREVFRGQKFQCKRVGDNSAALISIPATLVEVYFTSKALKISEAAERERTRAMVREQSRGHRQGRPRGAPARGQIVAASPTRAGLFDIFDCPTGNLTLIKQGDRGGFVKRCVERPDGVKAWETAYCVTPEKEWIPLAGSRRVGGRFYTCS